MTLGSLAFQETGWRKECPMTVRRPDPEEIARFLRGGLGGGENRRIVRHLIASWRVCKGEFEQIWEDPRASAPNGYHPAFRDLVSRLSDHARRVALERERLPGLITRLRELPPTGLPVLLQAETAFHSWLLGEWLIEESQRFAQADLGRAGTLASCAVTVAEALDSDLYGAPLVNDLKAWAWACKGEILRLLSDLRNAEEAFEVAEGFVAEGSGDALEESRVLELKAGLYRDQRQASAAHRLLDEVIAVYRQYRDSHLLGRAFIQKGRVHGSSSELGDAVSWVRKGLGLIDPSRERHVDLTARHSLMLYLNESGRPREARFLLKASRPEFLRHGSPLLICRLRWLEGKIYDSLKLPAEAERALVEARQGFIDLGAGFTAAGVSLDLAALYAAQGRAAEVGSLAAETLPIFQSHDLQKEAIGALIASRQAARVEEGSSRVLAEIRSLLDQARQDPRLGIERV
jgi:tetratricopeptide (TPR) repeat protein